MGMLWVLIAFPITCFGGGAYGKPRPYTLTGVTHMQLVGENVLKTKAKGKIWIGDHSKSDQFKLKVRVESSKSSNPARNKEFQKMVPFTASVSICRSQENSEIRINISKGASTDSDLHLTEQYRFVCMLLDMLLLNRTDVTDAAVKCENEGQTATLPKITSLYAGKFGKVQSFEAQSFDSPERFNVLALPKRTGVGSVLLHRFSKKEKGTHINLYVRELDRKTKLAKHAINFSAGRSVQQAKKSNLNVHTVLQWMKDPTNFSNRYRYCELRLEKP